MTRSQKIRMLKDAFEAGVAWVKKEMIYDGMTIKPAPDYKEWMEENYPKLIKEKE